MNQIKESAPKSTVIKIVFILTTILCLFTFVGAPIALISGFVFVFLFGHPFLRYNAKAVNWLLKIAVVGLGFGMNLKETLSVGKEGLSLTIVSIVLVLILGYLIGKFLKMQRKTMHLVSTGTAICGGSAIAAVAPIINASEKEISISLGVIFLLNSIALLVFPSIGHFFNLTEHQFGLWSAVAIHDTSSVVGAAADYGDEALKVATTVKLSRALWIIPLSIFSIFLFKGKSKKVKIPWFILLFIAAIILNSYVDLPEMITSSITVSSKSLLVLTLFLVGAGLSIENIKSSGWKPMLLGVSLWITVSAVSLGMIYSL